MPQPLLGRVATAGGESETTRPWSTIFGGDDDEDALLNEQQQMLRMMAAAKKHAVCDTQEEEEMKRLEEQFFVKICAREQAWTPQTQEKVRNQAVKTARRYWERRNGRPAPGGPVSDADCSYTPSPFDYFEAPRPLPNVDEHEMKFAEFEAKAKAKQYIKFTDIPWPDAEMFAACLLKSQDLAKTSKNWSRRWQ